ncbi:helix-turn-helix domain-containing protein [Mycobacterium yunnanensis]|uniref:Helix-turn-helix domain-containing protein n=1 Tax=Mycobacterium yunnanensis TaxID=368477 RepID=A0A9X3C3H3_9MYCO|nr:helix-turn-helix domain-containing protein [Mycobacterium yunnanensis]MCV7424388.1 helix-turn-helix domain-containing protein [Mycobacterium yunnanensis]
MTPRTFALQEVADAVLPPEWSDSVRWLTRRLNRGELSGYRVGKTWRMTEADVEALIAKHRPATQAPVVESAEPEAVATVSFLDGLSERSRRRLERSA